MPPINALNVTLIAISRSPLRTVELRADQHCLPITYMSRDAKYNAMSHECKARAASASVVVITFCSYYNELPPMMEYRGNE